MLSLNGRNTSGYPGRIDYARWRVSSWILWPCVIMRQGAHHFTRHIASLWTSWPCVPCVFVYTLIVHHYAFWGTLSVCHRASTLCSHDGYASPSVFLEAPLALCSSLYIMTGVALLLCRVHDRAKPCVFVSRYNDRVSLCVFVDTGESHSDQPRVGYRVARAEGVLA